MKPRIKLATTNAPDGSRLELYQHDQDFVITVDRHDLMVSRAHESELELARLGCAHVASQPNPTILVGGLGMGYTLRQALDLLGAQATVVVAELLPEIVRWNQDYLGELTHHPLQDPRVVLKIADVAEVLRQSPGAFDSVLLDIDNGPEAITDARNDQIYTPSGIRACLQALRPNGCLAIWSSFFDNSFERRLRQANVHVRNFPVPAYKGSTSRHCCIWLATHERPATRKAAPCERKETTMH